MGTCGKGRKESIHLPPGRPPLPGPQWVVQPRLPKDKVGLGTMGQTAGPRLRSVGPTWERTDPRALVHRSGDTEPKRSGRSTPRSPGVEWRAPLYDSSLAGIPRVLSRTVIPPAFSLNNNTPTTTLTSPVRLRVYLRARPPSAGAPDCSPRGREGGRT